MKNIVRKLAEGMNDITVEDVSMSNEHMEIYSVY